MINLCMASSNGDNDYTYIDEKEVLIVERAGDRTPDGSWLLSIHFKNGQTLTESYANKDDRDKVVDRLVDKINNLGRS